MARQISNPAALDAVANVHCRLLETLDGYDRMAADVRPGLRDTADRFRALHFVQARQLATILAHHGREADCTGSYFGTVEEGVMSVSSFYHEAEEDILTQIRTGEAQVLDAFDAAARAALTGEDLARIRLMRSELQQMLTRARPAAA